MYKLSIIILLIINMRLVLSCGSSEPPRRRPRPPAVPSYTSRPLCSNYSYKIYDDRCNLLTKLPDNKKLKELSLTGTHNSALYLLDDNKYKTQEFGIMEQLVFGVRVLDITVYLVSNIFKIYTNDINIDCTFGQLLTNLTIFLDDNPGEMIFLILHYKSNDSSIGNVCYTLNNYCINKIGGSRLIRSWSLEDTIDMHRGHILLASNEEVFEKCAFSLGTNCRLSKNFDIHGDLKTKKIYSQLDYEWFKYLNMVNSSRLDNYSCNIYDMSIKNDYLVPKFAAKYGGYYVIDDDDMELCVAPKNYKFYEYYFNKDNNNDSVEELNIYIFDYIVQEVIDLVNQINFN